MVDFIRTLLFIFKISHNVKKNVFLNQKCLKLNKYVLILKIYAGREHILIIDLSLFD